MKKLLLILAILCSNCLLKAQAPACLWAKHSVGSNVHELASCITADASGNSIVAGTFGGGSVVFGATTLTNAAAGGGTDDFFLVKYDAAGNIIWANSYGGTQDELPRSINTDLSGNIFVTGTYRSSSILFGSFTLPNIGNEDLFVVKFSPAGTVLWAKRAGGSMYDVGAGIATDASGNSFVTGHFQSNTIAFGAITLTNTTTTGFVDLFLVKYDPLGVVVWAKKAGGTSYDYGQGVSVDPSGNIIVSGSFRSPTIVFGTTTLTCNTSSGTNDFFVAKYDLAGNVLWAKEAGEDYSEDGSSGVSCDASGNVVVTGYYTSPAITFGAITLPSGGASGLYTNIFVVKYDSSGVVMWAKAGYGSEGDNDVSKDISIDPAGNIFIAGYFDHSTITFGSLTLLASETGLGYDFFLIKYDGAGNEMWVMSGVTGGPSGGYLEDANGMCLDPSGNIFIAGSFTSETITFGSTVLTNSDPNLYKDAFIVKLGSVSTAQIEKESDFGLFVFPNPSSGVFTIASNAGTDKATLRVLNVMGELVIEEKKISGNSLTLDLSKLTSGIYFVEINNSGATSRKSIIKK